MANHPNLGMKPIQTEPPGALPGGSPVALEAVLCTEELNRRPTRRPDYRAESRALVALARALADSPRSILQTLAATILEVLKAGSAGVSLISEDQQTFYWPAIAGAWQTHIGGGTPRDFGPCGDVLDCNAPLLFKHFERRYPYFLAVTPAVEEALLVPFHVDGQAVGTIWAVAHDGLRKFDAEDLRQLESLGSFASAAYQSRIMGEREQDRVALRLEEAVQSGQAMEKLNAELRAGEEALRESEAFNRSIVESSPDCIKVLDLQGNLLSMRNGHALLGIEDVRPYLNTSWIAFWESDADRAAARSAVAAALAGDEGRFVGFFRTLRGEPKWWDVTIAPILDAHGRPARLLAVSRDVTQRKQAEMNLEFLVSVSHDLLHWTSVDEMTRTVGAKMATYLDLSLCAFVEVDEAAEQVVIFHDWHRHDVPGLVGTYRLADFVEEEFIQVARAGQVIVVRDTAADPRTGPEKFAALKIASFICVPLIRDGQWRFALCFYHNAPYDWRDDEIELARELTARIWTRLERLRAEEALRESEKRYRMLFESIDEGLCVIEMIFDADDKPVDYRYLEVNPSFEKQSGMHNTIGKRVRELIPDIEKYWVEIYAKVAQTGEPLRYENVVKGLGDRWIDVYAFRLGGPESRKVAVLFTNITERKQFELNLSKAMAIADNANRAKSDFLSSMSHELRTPLSAILGFAQLMESGSPPPTPSQKRSIDQILRAGWYLLELINEILDLALVESGKLSLSPEIVSLGDLIDECKAMVEPQAQKRAIGMRFPSLAGAYFVKADRTRLKQVLINLLSNAIKYNKPGGTIMVACIASTPQRIRIRVEDTGEGLPAEKLEHLFQPFNRLGRQATAEEGTGIGLVMTKRLIELMGGVIGVQSTVGQGSVFWFEMNLTAERPAAIGAAPTIAAAPALVHADARLATLLYVEDNPANRMLVEDLIARRPDIRLLSAPDGQRGIAMARACVPDVILMDINLPGMSGIDALGVLAEDPATAHIPVLALSANAIPRDIALGLEAGFFRYLTKPIKVDEFMATLDLAMEFSLAVSGRAVKKEKT